MPGIRGRKIDLCNVYWLIYGNVDTLKMGGTFGHVQTAFFPLIGCHFRALCPIVQLDVNHIAGTAHKRGHHLATTSRGPLDKRNL